jgi:hypothetical protein
VQYLCVCMLTDFQRSLLFSNIRRFFGWYMDVADKCFLGFVRFTQLGLSCGTTTTPGVCCLRVSRKITPNVGIIMLHTPSLYPLFILHEKY